MYFDGSELKDRRLELDLSVEEASTQCAVPPHLAQALETGDLDSLPSESYAIGFLRSYCRNLGLQSEGYVTALKEAIKAHKTPAKVESKLATRRFPQFELPLLPIEFKREIKAWATVCALLALGWFTYSVIVPPDQDAQQTRAQAAAIDSRQMPVDTAR